MGGYLLALLVGVSLGLVGSGGSILTVPILVYVMAIEPVTATGYSLFVVGSTALVGGVRNAFNHNVNFSIAALFGIPSLITAYLVRAYLITSLPENFFSIGNFTVTKALFLMLLFAVVMLLAAFKMIRTVPVPNPDKKIEPLPLVFSGVITGLLAGAVGAGGGFLIIPALVFMAGLPMKRAVGTSLFIIAIQSLAGFAGDASGNTINWLFLLPFTLLSIMGIFIGILLSKKINGSKLKTGFGYFVLVMAVYILTKELLFK